MATFKWTSDSLVELHAKSSVHPIHGEVRDVRGEVSGEVKDGQITLDSAPTGWIEVPADALKSGKKLEDMQMRRVLEVKQYPTIRFDLREASGGPNEYKLKCTLTFHGVTKEFEETATARLENGVLHIEGEHTFNIEDYGVKAPKILNLKVYPDVRVVAHLVGKEG